MRRPSAKRDGSVLSAALWATREVERKNVWQTEQRTGGGRCSLGLHLGAKILRVLIKRMRSASRHAFFTTGCAPRSPPAAL